MILRSIVILVAMTAGTAFALDHPPLPHRVLHVISPAQLEATCPGTFACAIVYWGSAPATCTCLMRICRAGPRGGSCWRTSFGTATAEGRIRVPEGFALRVSAR